MLEEINKATEVIKNGGVILYPTETVWGLGCDPTNDTAIDRILEIKKRPENKSLIILVPSEAILQRYVKNIPEVCYDLIDFADRPLTIVYPDAQHLSEKLTAKDNSIAIRLTKDEFCRKLMQKLKTGIVSTSANISGNPPPVAFHDISEEIKNNVDYIVNLPDRKGTGTPSQIIKIKANSEVEIIRK
ncbi:MAG: threonylcarbamoyl-AMP synthase [Crocinitomicaceae bacterium]|nr:threonylcarbamoyl-AMP synthase [Crocinitomicaceae bacterium]